MVYVVASAVGEHGVHELHFDLRSERIGVAETTRIGAWALVLEIPIDAAQLAADVGVDKSA